MKHLVAGTSALALALDPFDAVFEGKSSEIVGRMPGAAVVYAKGKVIARLPARSTTHRHGIGNNLEEACQAVLTAKAIHTWPESSKCPCCGSELAAPDPSIECKVCGWAKAIS